MSIYAKIKVILANKEIQIENKGVIYILTNPFFPEYVLATQMM